MLQSRLPVVLGLAGDGEHQVDVDGGNTGLAEDADGFAGLGDRVLAAEDFQDVGGEGLDAQRDAGDAEVAEVPGLGGVEGGGVGFEGDFVELWEIDGVVERSEEPGDVAGGEHARGAAAEVKGAGISGDAGFRFSGEGIDEAPDGGVARSVLVKRAVRADAVAEGNVEVEQQGPFNRGF